MTRRDGIIFMVLATAFVLGGIRPQWGVTLNSPWWTHLAFQFTHGNIFHFAGNLLAVWVYCKSGKVKASLWLEAFAIASVISLLYVFDKPLIGFSGTIMAVLGAFLPRIWHNSSVKMSMLMLALMSVISLFFGQGGAVLFHALCILLGILLTKTKDLIYDIRKEEERTHRR